MSSSKSSMYNVNQNPNMATPLTLSPPCYPTNKQDNYDNDMKAMTTDYNDDDDDDGNQLIRCPNCKA
jgi:hypothetical protein